MIVRASKMSTIALSRFVRNSEFVRNSDTWMNSHAGFNHVKLTSASESLKQVRQVAMHTKSNLRF